MFHRSLDTIPALLKPAGVVYNNDLYSQLTNLLAYCQFHHERRNLFSKRKGERVVRGMARSTQTIWYCELFKYFLFPLKTKIWDSSLQYIERQQIYLCKGLLSLDFCLHNCTELNWQDLTLKCRFALLSVRHRILKLGHSPWGCWEL